MTQYKHNYELTVESNCFLLDFLYSKLKNKSKNNVKSLLSRGNVLVNGQVTTKYDYPLHKGQVVLISERQIRQATNNVLDIIYEDKDMIVINKPAGLLSIATNKETTKTAYHMVLNYVRGQNPKNRIFIVHRLDRDTSGILVIAKNEHLKLALQDKWNDLVTIRGYIAVVEGKMEKEHDTIRSLLKETSTQLVYSSKCVGDGQEAITHYNLIRGNDKLSLLDIKIDTGRKNQIRVHMKDIGHCVVGDKKYGAKTDPLRRLGLHSHILEFKHPFTGKIMHFEVPIPNDFINIC